MTTSSEFELLGHKYQSRTMDVFDQMVIAKRMMPLIKGIVTPDVISSIMTSSPETGKGKGKKALPASVQNENSTTMIKAIADAIYDLSDDDIKHIAHTCLKVCVRQNDGSGVWSTVTAPNGALMFSDITLPVMMQIVYKVLEAHLGDFFSTAL